MRLRRIGAGLCAVGALTLPLSGCSEADKEEERDERSTKGASVPSRQTPAARSGDLGQEDLPRPEQLGDGWDYRVDEGNAEEGYVGSGKPAIARDPASVVAAITPLGCRSRPLPVPARALEVTYQRDTVPGVAMVLQFGSAEPAREFFATHSSVVQNCVGAARITVKVLVASGDEFVSTRTEELGETPTWVEGMSVAGDRVTLVAVADPSGRGVGAVMAALP